MKEENEDISRQLKQWFGWDSWCFRGHDVYFVRHHNGLQDKIEAVFDEIVTWVS
jgi:hypothetical protein